MKCQKYCGKWGGGWGESRSLFWATRIKENNNRLSVLVLLAAPKRAS